MPRAMRSRTTSWRGEESFGSQSSPHLSPIGGKCSAHIVYIFWIFELT
jgi:hypothetical protein